MDNFIPDEDRKAHSICPSHFPKLSDFNWTTDYEEDLQCPSILLSNAQTCPIPVKKSSVVIQKKFDWGIVIIGFMIVAIFKFVRLKNKTIHYQSIDQMDAFKIEKECKEKVLPKLLKRRQYKKPH